MAPWIITYHTSASLSILIRIFLRILAFAVMVPFGISMQSVFERKGQQCFAGFYLKVTSMICMHGRALIMMIYARELLLTAHLVSVLFTLFSSSLLWSRHQTGYSTQTVVQREKHGRFIPKSALVFHALERSGSCFLAQLIIVVHAASEKASFATISSFFSTRETRALFWRRK